MVDAVKYLYDFESSDDLGNGDFSVLVRIADDYAALESRLADLETELADTESDLDAAVQHNMELQAKIAALEKDAARYRWLRDGGINELPIVARNGEEFMSTGSYLDGDVDVLIAMNEA